MINALLRIARIGCAHRRTTFPLTSRRYSGRTYVTCLDCGTELSYDWQAMRRGGPVHARERYMTLMPGAPAMGPAPTPAAEAVQPGR